MLSHYKESLHGVADPVARLLLRAHVRPNQLTVLGLGVSMVAAHAFFQGRLGVAAALLAVAGLFDFFDGSLARLAGSESASGVFLTMATLVGTIMVSYTKARAQSIGLKCEIGLMERPERMIVLIVGGVFHLLTPAVIVLALLTNLTALQRILYVRAKVREKTLR